MFNDCRKIAYNRLFEVLSLIVLTVGPLCMYRHVIRIGLYACMVHTENA